MKKKTDKKSQNETNPIKEPCPSRPVAWYTGIEWAVAYFETFREAEQAQAWMLKGGNSKWPSARAHYPEEATDHGIELWCVQFHLGNDRRPDLPIKRLVKSTSILDGGRMVEKVPGASEYQIWRKEQDEETLLRKAENQKRLREMGWDA